VLNAATAAFQRGDAATAAELYQRVVNTPPLPSEQAAATAAIDGFARFRAMLALLQTGHEAEAREQLDALQARDTQAVFARLGSQLWDQYGMTGQVRAACAQLRPQVASQAGAVLATLQNLGVSISPDTLCSVPQGGGGY
jgi:hypothetical protein